MNLSRTLNRWAWRTGLLGTLAIFEIILLIAAPYITPIPDTTIIPFVSAQVAGNGGAENSTVVYYKTTQIGAGPVVGTAPSCPSGWSPAYTPNDGYGPHYIAMVGYEWEHNGSGGDGGGFGSGGPDCFSPETPVRMADGSIKEIKDVKEGDIVDAFTADGNIVHSLVERVYHHPSVTTEVTIVAAGRTVITTPVHPFFIGEGKFKQVKDLKVGDTIYALDAVTSKLEPVRINDMVYETGSFEVYNLEVEGSHTFIAGDFAVHNKPTTPIDCFTGDTPVRMADGTTKNIQDIKVGDAIISFNNNGELARSIVRATYFHPSVDETVAIMAGGRAVTTTPVHPFYIGNGEFKNAGDLKVGDDIYLYDAAQSGLQKTKIEDIAFIKGSFPVYNLTVDEPHTFIAAGFGVHNKIDCFAPDTLVRMADGSTKKIKDVQVGDVVVAFNENGVVVRSVVEEVYRHPSVATEVTLVAGDRTVITTPVHPFYIGNGEFKEVQELSVGDIVYIYEHDSLKPVRIESMEYKTGNFEVFNLEVADSHTFIAGDFAVHNKINGDCFVGETLIRMADGSTKQIRDVRVGDMVEAFDERGLLIHAAVQSVFRHPSVTTEVTIVAGDRTVVTTPPHPFFVGNGDFKQVKDLKVGDTIYALDAVTSKLEPVRINDMVYETGSFEVYNLEVEGSHTFIAGDFAVHNKNGDCFTAGTLVSMADGSRLPIQEVKVGDIVTSFDHNGEIIQAPVKTLFRHPSVATEVTLVAGDRTVITTPVHPFYIGNGEFKEVQELSVGDIVYIYEHDSLKPVRIESMEYKTGNFEVFNLEVADSHTFIAGDFAVHNKPGGGGGGNQGGGGGGFGNFPTLTPAGESIASALNGLLGVPEAHAQTNDVYSVVHNIVAIGSDSVCSASQKTIVPISQFYQNSIVTANNTAFFSDACSIITNPVTGVTKTECNRCQVCVRP